MVMNDANKIDHIFTTAHKPEPLVQKFGSQENALKAILKAVNGSLPANGVFTNVAVKVAGETVVLRGNVINGVIRIGTVFAK